MKATRHTWTKEERQFLAETYTSLTAQQQAEQLGMTYYQVVKQREQLRKHNIIRLERRWRPIAPPPLCSECGTNTATVKSQLCQRCAWRTYKRRWSERNKERLAAARKAKQHPASPACGVCNVLLSRHPRCSLCGLLAGPNHEISTLARVGLRLLCGLCIAEQRRKAS